ncbi:hypothetical protein F4782DRAFT_489748 [Xylaria castorea]|nr:hypothetical protein F4782DRAFT_489748 [Xylaria castorea]
MGGSMTSSVHGLRSANFLPLARLNPLVKLSTRKRRFAKRHVLPMQVPWLLSTTFRSTAGQGTGRTRVSGFSDFRRTTEDMSGKLGGNGPDQKITTRHILHAVAATMNDDSGVVDLLEDRAKVDEDVGELKHDEQRTLTTTQSIVYKGTSAGTS